MKKLISSPESYKDLKKNGYWVFLAGPCQGAPEWQLDFYEDFPGDVDITFFNPRREGLSDGPEYYEEQLEWESTYLNAADKILFWFPPMERAVPGRDYGQTTRVELGEWISKYPDKLIIGIDPSISGRRYFCEKLGREVFENLADLEMALVQEYDRVSDKRETFYTSDTHFGSQRTLELSRRPFKSVHQMDMAMIREWNGVVSPFDKVYHLGDFGNPEILRFLNGDIKLIPGNYEDNPELLEFIERGVSICQSVCIKELKDSTTVAMAHRPSVVRNVKNVDLWLFGHTHGRQHVKNWPGIDVGVDGNHFRPVSEDEILFWKEAITKYYDFENWI